MSMCYRQNEQVLSLHAKHAQVRFGYAQSIGSESNQEINGWLEQNAMNIVCLQVDKTKYNKKERWRKQTNY